MGAATVGRNLGTCHPSWLSRDVIDTPSLNKEAALDWERVEQIVFSR